MYSRKKAAEYLEFQDFSTAFSLCDLYILWVALIVYVKDYIYILIHRSAHQLVHDELTELSAIVAVNGI